ncbi:hypothetical protein EC915_101299 [Pseudomonas sp. LP_7_YM]|nr:hypothetical protein EC915_101299 [Pseudomonas sp. LP_7_YM]
MDIAPPVTVPITSRYAGFQKQGANVPTYDGFHNQCQISSFMRQQGPPEARVTSESQAQSYQLPLAGCGKLSVPLS